jgi:hypothetical protein
MDRSRYHRESLVQTTYEGSIEQDRAPSYEDGKTKGIPRSKDRLVKIKFS